MRVIITGMHRSGTSMTAALLGFCGLDIGNNFRPIQASNAKGYFEDLDFKAVNKRLLKISGGGKGSFNPPLIIKEDEESRQLVRAFLFKWKGRGPAGWKDPRASLTIHIWNKYISNLQVVVCLRPHIEIAQSLRTRNGFSIEKGLKVTDAYLKTLNFHVLANKIPAHYINYHDLMRDWRAHLPRLCVDLGIGGPKDEAAIDDFIEPALWHERQGEK